MKWTESEKKILADMYPSVESAKIADKLGKTQSQVYNMAYSMGIKKEKGFASRINKLRWQEGAMEGCRKGHYKKGEEPMNKGLKQPEFMSKEAISRTAKTRFKKGNKPHNYRPIGSERITKDGYIEVKTSDPNTWELKHRIEWEKVNGKVPKGFIVCLIDGNKLNTEMNNLELVKRSKAIDRNTIHRYPREIKNLIRLQSKLNKQLHGTK